VELQQTITIFPPNGEFLSKRKINRLHRKIDKWKQQDYWISQELVAKSQFFRRKTVHINIRDVFETLILAIFIQNYYELAQSVMPIYEEIFREKFRQLTGKEFPTNEELPYNWRTSLPTGTTFLGMLLREAAYRAGLVSRQIAGLYDDMEDVEDEFLIQKELGRAKNALLMPRKNKGFHGILDTIMSFCVGFAVMYATAKNYFTKYKFHAVVDDRTTETCLSLNDTIFRGTDAILGVNVPPIIEPPHACRSWIEVYTDEKSFDENLDKNSSGDIIKESNIEIPKSADETPTENITETEKGHLAHLETTKDLEDYARKKWGVENVNLNGLDVNAVRGTFESMDKAFEIWPELKGQVHGIGQVRNMALMTTHIPANSTEKTINFNPAPYRQSSNDYNAVKNLNRDYSRRVASGFFPQNTTWKDSGVHELGHIAHYLLEERKPNMTVDKIVNDAWNRVKNRYTSDITQPEAIQQISTYSTYRFEDTIAEAFNDVFVNEKNAQPLSREIVEIIQEGLR